jgi:hypothetical protein
VHAKAGGFEGICFFFAKAPSTAKLAKEYRKTEGKILGFLGELGVPWRLGEEK